jgi:outer membrane protein assembly factor BamB
MDSQRRNLGLLASARPGYVVVVFRPLRPVDYGSPTGRVDRLDLQRIIATDRGRLKTCPTRPINLTRENQSMSTMDPARSASASQRASSKDTGRNLPWQARPIRLWPAIAIVAFFWVFYFSADYVEMTMFMRFISRFGMYGIVILSFLVWWMGFSRVPWKERFLGLGVLIIAAIGAGLLADKKSLGTMGPAGAFMAGFPFALTGWTMWLAICKALDAPPKARRIGLCAVIIGALGFFDLVRWEGLDGGQHSAFGWRWSKTAEERFLDEHSAPPKVEQAAAAQSLKLQPADWPEFRGPGRDNRVYGVKLATDWDSQPPKQLWRHRVGPAWSSVIVVDGKLFTQEQRGDNEAVVCYDAGTGEETWSHEDNTKFFEPLSQDGPRGTPTFADGRIYALGATGKLNCLDAATGKAIWSHDIDKDAGAEVEPGGFAMRQWGYANSPLVVGDLVIVFAGGDHDKGLLAYSADKGEQIWEFAAGTDGYSSPQLASLGGQTQVLIHCDKRLAAVDPATGKLSWQWPSKGMLLPITQPQPVGEGQFLAQAEDGVQLVKVSHSEDGWTPQRKWESGAIKPSLNDYVVHNGTAYGFSDGVFCCLDMETGKRRWKGGRYGHGQVLLLADQPLLFVMSENGEGVLIAPDEKKLNEQARFQAIEGKTWNHPVIAHGKLYARNAEEMACYDLPLAAQN